VGTGAADGHADRLVAAPPGRGRATWKDGRSPLVHVIFPLTVDDEGWPPVSAERVWARRVGATEFRLENAPWFVRGVAEGDIVRAIAATDDEWPSFVETLQWSGNCTIRVIPYKQGPLAGDHAAVLDLVRSG
jgi:hypothetical protein